MDNHSDECIETTIKKKTEGTRHCLFQSEYLFSLVGTVCVCLWCVFVCLSPMVLLNCLCWEYGFAAKFCAQVQFLTMAFRYQVFC